MAAADEKDEILAMRMQLPGFISIIRSGPSYPIIQCGLLGKSGIAKTKCAESLYSLSSLTLTRPRGIDRWRFCRRLGSRSMSLRS